MTTDPTFAVTASTSDGPAVLLERATEYAAAIGEPYPVSDEDAAAVMRVVPVGWKVETTDLERYSRTPHRARGKVLLHDTDSFVSHVKDFTTDTTRVYVDSLKACAVAVFDDHRLDATSEVAAGWREHRALISWMRTPAWEFWLKRDRQMVDQLSFAEHVEEGLTEIAEPPGADLLELAQTFKASVNAEVRSARHLQSGQVAVSYVEQIEAGAGQGGDYRLPERFTLVLAPFEGSPQATISARLRFRLERGKLTLGYLLDRPREFERAALQTEVSRIVAGVSCPIVLGVPEA